MARYGADNATCFVLTFKEGLLSSVAHDLRLRVTRFSVEVDVAAGSVNASFDTSSLVVDCPLKDGVDNPSALSASDRDKVASQIREEVLHSARFPQATFRSKSLVLQSDGGYEVEGELTLHGVKRALSLRTTLQEGRQHGETVLHQPDFGITPFRAMLGTLKIQPDVKLRFSL